MLKKITAQGPKNRKSYTVTLPIDWVKKEGLNKRKEVELLIVQNKIILTNAQEPVKELHISEKDYAQTLIKILQAAYRLGIHQIKIQYKSSEYLSQIVNILEEKLIGFEIIEQQNNLVVLKEITKESEEDFRTILRRIFLLILQLSECLSVDEAKLTSRSIKKLINYCQRILVNKGHSEFTKIPFYYLVLDRLEKISDEYRWLIESKKQYSEYAQSRKQIKELLRGAYELFYTFNAKQFNDFDHQTYMLKNKIKDMKNPSVESMHLHNLARFLNSLYGDICSLKIEETP